MRGWRQVIGMLGVAAAVCGSALGGSAAGDEPRTGPETEKRFPALKVPRGFQATLFACDPLVEYPSVAALGPRAGTLFVAHDYMTGLGTEITRRDEIRLVADTDADGYADKSTLYAGGFNSIQGMAYDGEWVYAMHSPLLTRMRDTDGDGVADERRDLLSGLGLAPEDNPPRLHCANGVVVGHDGWLYLALGDHGCDVARPEGDRLVFHGGGILRCRPDGSALHVFATGLRNIYDVALDEQLNVFVRDNENDGGDYKIRVYHSFFGADHGYPYLYHERPELAYAPRADLGLGSSAGGACYLETDFPAEYRGNLFFCEWGRAVVRYARRPEGGTFAAMEEFEFAAGAQDDPYGFKPTDVVVDRDGSLLVTDWADGQRPRRGRGRVYRIRYVGNAPSAAPSAQPADVLERLNSDGYHVRIEAQTQLERRGDEAVAELLPAMQDGRLEIVGRLHGVWVLAKSGAPESIEQLFEIAEHDPAVAVRAQAVRAIGDLTDPVLVQGRLAPSRGDERVAQRLASLAVDENGPVLLEVLVALGRLRWPQAADWLRHHYSGGDAAVEHMVMQALRRSRNWTAVLELLDEADAAPVRELARRAVVGQFEAEMVDGLVARLASEKDARRRSEYGDVLAGVYKKPGPWVYWNYRPAPRAANTEVWARTEAIGAALDRLLGDRDGDVRLATLLRMQRERVPARVETLGPWLDEERRPEAVAAILESLRGAPAEAVRDDLFGVVRDAEHALENRTAALAMVSRGLDAVSEGLLLELAESLEDGPVLAGTLTELVKRPGIDSASLLLSKLDSSSADVRLAAVAGLGALGAEEAGEAVRALLADADGDVRAAAARAMGTLGIRAASGSLVRLASDEVAGVRSAALVSLRLLGEPGATESAAEALEERETELAALEYLADFGGAEHAEAVGRVARQSRSMEVLVAAVRGLDRWRDEDAIAQLQGESGALVRWLTMGPVAEEAARSRLEQATTGALPDWQASLAEGTELQLRLPRENAPEENATWLAVTDFAVAQEVVGQFLLSSSGTLEVWLDGRLVYRREQAGAYRPDSDRFEATLTRGTHRVALAVSTEGAARFHARMRVKSSKAEHERLAQAALARAGNAERGRELFFNAAKSQCIKCHRMGTEGGKIGPELTGVGRRFSRIHLIESILEPSRTIAPSFQAMVVATRDGRILTGVKVKEAETVLTLGDSQGQLHEIAKSEIDESAAQEVSVMPEGLEKALSEGQFVDLIAFLVSQRDDGESDE